MPIFKVIPIIKCSRTVLLITSEIVQLTHQYRYQFVGEVITDLWSIKEMIQCTTLGTPKGMKKILFLLLFALTF